MHNYHPTQSYQDASGSLMAENIDLQYLTPPHNFTPSSAHTHYTPTTPYTPTYHADPPIHIHSAGPSRPDVQQRRRPKYTRSKTGCLTCRQKKVKCDEAKPTCVRCAQSSRDCSWPENVSFSTPILRKWPSRRDRIDIALTTDSSDNTSPSNLSEPSTPVSPVVPIIPQSEPPLDLHPPHMGSMRRFSNPDLHIQVPYNIDYSHHHGNPTLLHNSPASQSYSPNSNALPMIPELQPSYSPIHTDTISNVYSVGGMPAVPSPPRSIPTHGFPTPWITSTGFINHQSDPIEPYFHSPELEQQAMAGNPSYTYHEYPNSFR